MPTIRQVGGYRIFFRFNEEKHHLAHVHVECPSGEVSVALAAHDQPVRLLGFTKGMKRAEVRRAVQLVTENHAECVREWEERDV